MGNCLISVHATGAHHNGSPHDIDRLAAEFVDKLKSAGSNVTAATITAGGEHDLTNVEARFPLKSENPEFYNR